MNNEIVKLIAKESEASENQVEAVLKLKNEGATIPFIARYRKEQTQGATETEVKLIFQLEEYYDKLIKRKATITNAIKEQGKLTPKIEKAIAESWDATQLEAIYSVFKKKRKTKADKARDAGLEGLAKILMAQRDDPKKVIHQFLNAQVTTPEEAIEGAQHIIAQWMNEDLELRKRLMSIYERQAVLESRVYESKKDSAQQYRDYFNYSEPLKRVPSHRLLAVRRGENESLLRVSITMDDDYAIQQLERRYIRPQSRTAKFIKEAATDAWNRLISRSLENEIAKKAKLKADLEAISVFAKNLNQLLLEPPIGEKFTMSIDPGYRTGCKVAILNKQGDFLHHTVIYPHSGQFKAEEAKQNILRILEKYPIEVIGIGNGTAGRETEAFIRDVIGDTDINVYLISEAGASIYSASDVAIEEFPNLDITVRGAISIGRRLMDPLAELVKIDAKSIGVGQYQHDVQQDLLRDALETEVLSCVNQVGINLNTASAHLLSYVAGIGPVLANNIVEYRKEYGHFSSIKDLLKVKGLGKKSFQQCAGFLRIREGKNPLDNSGIHPERYDLVKKAAKDHQMTISELLHNAAAVNDISWNRYLSEEVGMPTIEDIKKELIKPGHDPRGTAQEFQFDKNVREFKDLSEQMILPGAITNITKFGAFVDIGIKENGLVHISEMVNRFITDPTEVVHLGQKVKVKIISIDHQRKRIQLSMKQV